MSSNHKVVNLSGGYITPRINELQANRKPWIDIGLEEGNDYFDTLIKRYNTSPTNQACIDGTTDLILGKGIKARNGNKQLEDYLYTLTNEDEIRKIVETETDAIIVASFGTFSTGINIKNLHNIIFASPSKSRIRVLQSIGRGLRKSEGKDIATLYDISDDFRYNKKPNFTLTHFVERVKIYTEEKFPFKFYKISIKDEQHSDSKTL
jgi:superfamily II DNA or RNA helicase